MSTTHTPLSAEEIAQLNELEARQEHPAPWKVLCADLRYRDWEFIVENRNALPRLIATIERLTAERDAAIANINLLADAVEIGHKAMDGDCPRADEKGEDYTLFTRIRKMRDAAFEAGRQSGLIAASGIANSALLWQRDAAFEAGRVKGLTEAAVECDSVNATYTRTTTTSERVTEISRPVADRIRSLLPQTQTP